jgi:hypothetical protein
MYEEKRIDDVTGVIRDGIKEVQPLPAQDGNRDWGVYYYRKGEPTKPHTKYVDEVIESGVKEIKPSGSEFPKWADNVIKYGVKE